jgi:endonuclease G
MLNFISKLFKKIVYFVKNIFSLPPPEGDEKPTPTKPSSKTQYIKIDPDYAAKKGYDKQFLGQIIDLPTIPAHSKDHIAIPDGKKNGELKYHHYSLVMNKKRKMPFFTAVNINALSYENLKENIPSRTEIGRDKWYFDPRIPENTQLPASFYDKNDFDLGHLVRREDALWGDTLEFAIKANNDTFHLTNACPQHKDFNRNAKRWLGLENYAIKNARKNDLKISVFTGPIMTDNDRKLNNVAIPAKYWKIIVMIKEDGTLSATGYIVQQDDLIEDITVRGFTYEQFQTYQVPINEIEEATQLSFGLNEYDPLQNVRSRDLLYEPHKIEDFRQIQF